MSKTNKKNIPQKKNVSKPGPKKDSKGGLVLALLLLSIFTFVCFSNAFKNEFTNWDDPGYVLDNPLVKSLSFENIKKIFSQNVMGNYHPISILSLAIDFHFYKLSPHGFHTTSILIHFFNVLLVFAFFRLLTGRIIIAFITALFFGIHPMHVESVSWVAERKDVLYFFFYMASLCMYVFFIRKQGKKWLFYALTLLLFIFSLLSKGQAVTLPVVLLLIDYFTGRKFDKKCIFEKIPFFIIALFFGLVAFYAQKISGAITDIPVFPLYERILFASYSLLSYTLKMIFPESLSAFYPYPTKVNNVLPVYFFAAPVVLLVLLLLFIRYFKKNKALAFGICFYILNLVLLLQVLPVGGSMMSERYTYLSYLGLFFITGTAFSKIWFSQNKKLSGYKYLFAFVLFVYTGYISYKTFERNKVWKNSEVLWTDVIKQYKNVVIAYGNRGSYYQKNEKIDAALADFNEALRLKPDHPEALVNRSDIFRKKGQYDLSIADCDKALNAVKDYPGAYMNRGIAYCIVGRYDEAFNDFGKVIAQDPKNPNVYCNRGNLYDMRGKLDSALADYSKAIFLKPEYAEAYYNRGKTYIRLTNFDAAINDFNSALNYNSKSPETYYFRSYAYRSKKDYSNALKDARIAKEMGYPTANDAYINELQSMLNH
jgi:tetratricopeptide (TPR) repeat protein